MGRSRTAEEGTGIPALLDKLVNCFTKNEGRSTASYKMALNYIMSTLPATNSKNYEEDEQLVVNEIRRHLLLTQSKESADSFDMYYTKLQSRSVLNHRSKILSLLLNLATGPPDEQHSTWNMNVGLKKVNTHRNKTYQSVRSASTIGHFLPDDARFIKKIYQGSAAKNYPSLSYAAHVSQTTSSNSDHDLGVLKDRSSSAGSSRSTIAASRGNLIVLPQSLLIQEVIYSFQGIEGRLLRKDPTGLVFNIDPKFSRGLSPSQRGMVEQLTTIGFLHNQLRQQCDEADKQIGLIGQSLIATLRDELTHYYKMVAILQAQLKKQGCDDTTDLTLRRIVVWVAEPQRHLDWLAHIAEHSCDKKGGALVSSVHRFLRHGSNCALQVSAKVLSAVCTPLYLMLSNWLLDGKLNDPCGEFFIEARAISAPERLWHDKYHVRKSMIPSFITLEQANKILAAGKSINFLRQICKDDEELPGRGALINLFETVKAEALFAPEQTIVLRNAIESVFRETSARVLDLLKNKYQLMDHFQALRRYLLLGQGDFIRHLLELLSPELCRPVEDLYGHTLTGLLETAIRVTNAQYEDEYIIQRLCVSLMSNSAGDIGWEVFTLVYLTDGPVETIFKPMETSYKALFSALWRAKRMEFVLSSMRKQQLSCGKLYKNMAEVRPVSHAIHMLTSEMIHFLQQTQYYFLFEVIECSWAELLRRVNQASCLDSVIAAHTTFLASVKTGVLLDAASHDLQFQLIHIFNLILNLESVQQAFYTAAANEHESIRLHQELCESKSQFEYTNKVEQERKDRALQFSQHLTAIRNQIRKLSSSYKDFIKKFLTLLAGSANMNLQLLSVRLNFNDTYKLDV